MDGLVCAIPIFFVLMGVEAPVNRVRFGATRAPSLSSPARAGVAVGLMAWLLAGAAALERRRRMAATNGEVV